MRTRSMMTLFLILALSSACQRDEDTGSSETNITADTATQEILQLDPSPTATLPEQTQAPVPAPDPLASPQQPVKPAAKQEALNPPHGQPGHRCEIPVGAPLSSAPKLSHQPPINPPPLPVNNTVPANEPSMPVNSTPVPDPGTTVTPPGMNPPHGQPGHRCEIPVGAPLPTE